MGREVEVGILASWILWKKTYVIFELLPRAKVDRMSLDIELASQGQGDDGDCQRVWRVAMAQAWDRACCGRNCVRHPGVVHSWVADGCPVVVGDCRSLVLSG
jgi:hypothetical protein